MKKYNFEFYEIANFGGLSIDTITDSDLDNVLYNLDSMITTKHLKGFYSLDKEAFNVLFTVTNN